MWHYNVKQALQSMAANELKVFYEHAEYISLDSDNLVEVRSNISPCPYLMLADLLRKFRINKSLAMKGYQEHEFKPFAKIQQHDLGFLHSGNVNFTVYWQSGVIDAPFFVYQFRTRVSRRNLDERIRFKNPAVDHASYVGMLRRNARDLKVILGGQHIFMPVLAIMAIKDRRHPFWSAGGAKGRSLSM